MATQFGKFVDDNFNVQLCSNLIACHPKILDVMTLFEIFSALEIQSSKNRGWDYPYRNGTVTLQQLLYWMIDQWVLKMATNKSYDSGAATTEKLIEAFEKGGCVHAANIARKLAASTPIEGEPNIPNIVEKLSCQTDSFSGDLTEDHELPAEFKCKKLGLINAGGFGVVYKAEGQLGGEFYAVKLISVGRFIQLTQITEKDKEGYFDKLLREVRALGRADKSPFVVSYKAYCFQGPMAQSLSALFQDPTSKAYQEIKAKATPSEVDRDMLETFFCIKMELCEGDLQHWMQTHPFPGRKSKIGYIETRILQNILLGLEFLHSQSIAHRDLRPQNILYSKMNPKNEDDVIFKIGDLGLAREISDHSTDLSVSVGFEVYRSPEMSVGKGNYGCSTDLFSLGLIYLVLIHQINIRDCYFLFESIRRGDLTVIPQLEKAYGRDFPLLERMLQRNKELRITASDALRLLQKA